MNKEAQRVAIAGACGWMDLRFKGGRARARFLTGRKAGVSFRYPSGKVPDYLRNRDAIMEPVLELDGTEKPGADGFLWSPRCEFLRQLEIVVSRNHPELKERIQFALVTATAEELGEAYLRARGDWEETT